MSGMAFKRVRKAVGLEVSRKPLPKCTDIGGYPLFYVFKDGSLCCPNCANGNIAAIDAERNNSHGGWALDGYDTNWEDTELACDHCGEFIPSAYEKEADAFIIHIDICTFKVWYGRSPRPHAPECPKCVRVSKALYTLARTWESTPCSQDHLLSGIIADHMTDNPEEPDGPDAEEQKRLLTVFQRFHAACFANNGQDVPAGARTRKWRIIWDDVFLGPAKPRGYQLFIEKDQNS